MEILKISHIFQNALLTLKRIVWYSKGTEDTKGRKPIIVIG